MKSLPFFSLLLLFFTVSCTNKDKDPNPEDFILGSWEYSSVVYNGKLIPIGFSDEYETQWIFNSDGTYYKKLSYYSDDPISFSEGTWRFKNKFSQLVLKDALSGLEIEWDLVDARNDFLKIKVSSSSLSNPSKTVAEFDMIPAD